MYGRYPPGNHRNPYPATPAYKVTGEAVQADATHYVLREVEDNFSGVLLPTIGLIVKI